MTTFPLKWYFILICKFLSFDHGEYMIKYTLALNIITLERLSIECLKFKTTNTSYMYYSSQAQKTNNTISQSEQHHTMCKQAMIGSSSTSDWLRKWHKFSNQSQSLKSSKTKGNTHYITLIWHSIENHSVTMTMIIFIIFYLQMYI